MIMMNGSNGQKVWSGNLNAVFVAPCVVNIRINHISDLALFQSQY